ncbi:MAG: hypothetical protein KKH83_06395 [Candidatus Margulisbacteria bacterium]|nr:hypothetical protein [Candidatus Margulisiibacteriota bacterium]
MTKLVRIGTISSIPGTTSSGRTTPINKFWKDMSWARDMMGNIACVQRPYIQEKARQEFCEIRQISQSHFFRNAAKVIKGMLPGVEEYLEPIRPDDGVGLARLLEAAALICSRFDPDLDRIHRVFPHFDFIDGERGNVLAVWDGDRFRGFPLPAGRNNNLFSGKNTSVNIVSAREDDQITFFQRHNINAQLALIFGCDVPATVESILYYKNTIFPALQYLAQCQAGVQVRPR